MAKLYFRKKAYLHATDLFFVGWREVKDASALSRLSLLLQEYQIISGDIGCPGNQLREKLEGIRQQLQKQGHEIVVLDDE